MTLEISINNEISDIAQSERDFHNQRAESEGSASERLSYVYHSVADVLEIPVTRLMRQSGEVLEVGCYLGENSGRAHTAARYVGIDISDVAIAKAAKLYADARTSFYCIDANYLDQLDGQFDYVFGNGVLHHLELTMFSGGLSEKMRKGASAVFLEPLSGPFWLRWFRALTPWLRTEDEHPFDEHYMDILRDNFEVELEYFGFFRPLLPILFFNWGPVIKIATSLDKLVMKSEFGRRNAWLVVISLSIKDT